MTITISQDFQQEFEVKKSRFICQIKRVATEEEARGFLAAVKKAQFKANHNCSAFILGARQEIQRSSDDGEPSGTAGVPMLEVFKKREITNVCAVVSRYFGGIKLGAGGLIHAYSHIVSETLDAVGLVKIVEQQELILTLDYALFDSLTNWLQTPIFEQNFAENVQVKIFLDEKAAPVFLIDLREKFSGRIPAQKGAKRLVEVPI